MALLCGSIALIVMGTGFALALIIGGKDDDTL